jgi:hypothetical protein
MSQAGSIAGAPARAYFGSAEGEKFMLAGLLLLVILTMKLFPAVPASRFLHRMLVELPLQRLAVMDRRHLIFGVMLVGMLFASAELIMMLGSADVVMVMAWDVSLYVDALLAAWALAAVARSKAAWRAFADIMTRPLRTARRRTPRRRRAAATKAANDADEDRPVWAYAA